MVGVQHHHAHLAACLAEHGETGPAVGAIYDGTGYGPDGTVWGGELLVGGLAGVRARAGCCSRCGFPGGDAADPRAMADGVRLAGRGDRRERRRRPDRSLHERRRAKPTGSGVRAARPADSNSPLTTSVGRLFDAVAALCGLRADGQLRGPGRRRARGGLRPDRARRVSAATDRRRSGAGPLILDARETVARDRRRPRRGEPPARVGGSFHARSRSPRQPRCKREAERQGSATGRPVGRRVPEPAAARADAALSAARRAARPAPQPPAAQRRRDRLRPGRGRRRAAVARAAVPR